MANVWSASDLLRAMVRFPSLSHEEGPIADWLETHLRQYPVHVGRRDDNIYAWIGEGEHTVLLNSHLDVVPPSADHPHGAFDGYEANGQLWGRGTVDAKASGAAMLTALLALAREGYSPNNGRVMVALTTCEETGGGYNGLEDLRPHLPPISAALVGEPTQMQPCVAQKGLLILNLEARGKTAHAARAHLGDNAIYRAARDIVKLSHIGFDRMDPYLGAPTLAVTMISGGTASNVVPDRATAKIDIRSTPAYTHDELIAYVQAHTESAITVHSKRLIPVATDPAHPIVQACLAARPDAVPFGSPTMSDWLFLADVPTVKIGPGMSERSHTPHEHIALEDVEHAAALYHAILTHYFNSFP